MVKNTLHYMKMVDCWKRKDIDVLVSLIDVCGGYSFDEIVIYLKGMMDDRCMSLTIQVDDYGNQYILSYPEVYLPICVINFASSSANIQKQLEYFIITIKSCLVTRYWCISDDKNPDLMEEMIQDAMNPTVWMC